MWLMEVLELGEIRFFYPKKEIGHCKLWNGRRVVIGVLWGYRDGSNSRPFVLLKQFVYLYPQI